jgi:hypothetical protein
MHYAVLTQPEMRSGIFLVVKALTALEADNLTSIFGLIVWEECGIRDYSQPYTPS